MLCLLRGAGSESSQFTPNYLNSGEAFSSENSFRAAVMVVLQLKNLPYLALLFLKMTVERNEPSFVSIIGKLDAMSFQLENEGLI